MLTQTLSFELSKELAFLALLAIFIYIIAYIARTKNLFSLPHCKTKNSINILHVGTSILLFFFPISLIGITSFPLISALLSKYQMTPVTKQILLTFFTLMLMIISLSIYLLIVGKKVRKSIWKPTGFGSMLTGFKDIGWGFIIFFAALPVTLLLSNLTNLIISQVFGVTELPDQEAVFFIKKVLSQPRLIFFGFSTVSLLVPFIEEFLFRGILQNWFKNFFRPSLSILISSFLFTISHFSINQKLANFPLLISIFALSLILGLIYEKRGSLIASISLHATFNSMVLLQILFLQNT